MEKDKKVLVKIGSSQSEFFVKELEQLSYFKAKLSDRWKSANKISEHQDVIEIFDQATTTETPFTTNDLTLLLKCCQEQCIPNNLELDSEKLEGLIQCSDYFSSMNDQYRITKDSLIAYFKNCTPGIDAQQRTNILQTTNNELIKTAMVEYCDILNEKYELLRQSLVSNYSKFQDKLSIIGFDSLTARQLFCQIFVLNISNINTDDKLQTKVKIPNFQDRETYLNLWKRRIYDDKLSIISMLVPLINKLLSIAESQKMRKSDNWHNKVLMNWDEYWVVDTMLLDICNDLLTNRLKPDLIKKNNLNNCFNLCKLCRARIIFLHEIGGNWNGIDTSFCKFIVTVPVNEVDLFIQLVFDNYSWYDQYYKCPDVENIEKRQQVTNSWHELIKFCLLRCSIDTVLKNIEIWFPSFYDHDVNSKKWILDQLVSKMGGEARFDVAIYLSNYIVFQWDKEKPFPEEYLNLLQKEFGMEWTIDSVKS